MTYPITAGDIVISATGASAPILTKARIEAVMRPRRNRPLFIIDIALPRDVEPAAGEIEQVFLYNIDDLQATVRENLARRANEVAHAEAIVGEEVEKFGAWLRARGAVPTVVALRERFESIRRAELERLEFKLASLPPEARARVTKELGLDKPLIVQYGIYIGRVLRGDLGTSYIRSGESVSAEIARRFPATIELTLAAMFIAILVGVPAGILSAVRPRSWIDYLGMSVSLAGVSIPVFWLGLLLVLAFQQWLPVSGNIDPSLEIARRTGFMVIDCALAGDGRALADALRHLVLPAITLSTIPLAMTARITRSSMLEVLGSDYVRTAKAKGLRWRRIVLVHVLRNSLIPAVTAAGPLLGFLITGSFIIEFIFAIPGIGRYYITAVQARDYSVVMGLTVLLSVIIVFANLVVDILYGVLDPRTREARA